MTTFKVIAESKIGFVSRIMEGMGSSRLRPLEGLEDDFFLLGGGVGALVLRW